MSKFRSEDLLKSMGLKLKDKIYFCDGYYQRRTFTIKMVKGVEFEEVPMLVDNDVKLKLLNLLDHEYTIIQPKPTLTEDEKIILRNVPKGVKYIAKNRFSGLIMLYEKQGRNDYYWYGSGSKCDFPFDHLFKFIKWEDEPYLIKELLEEDDE
jgi:hypothetical protein